MDNQQCSVGRILAESECHLIICSKLISMEYLEQFETNERKIVISRTGLSILNIRPTVGLHPSFGYLKRYEANKNDGVTHFPYIAKLQKVFFNPLVFKLIQLGFRKQLWYLKA